MTFIGNVKDIWQFINLRYYDVHISFIYPPMTVMFNVCCLRDPSKNTRKSAPFVFTKILVLS